MEYHKLNSTFETRQDPLEEKNEESLHCIEENSSTLFPDQDGKSELDGCEENSVVTLASTSLSSQTIKVYLRLKPLPLEIGLTREQEEAYTIVNSTTLLTKFPGLDVNTRSLKNLKASERVSRTFTFTAAFGSVISQSELFNEAMKSQVLKFLAGQSSTVMSYGTSNAGKSYTLYGTSSALGIIPLSINFIFHQIRTMLSTPRYKPAHQNHVIGLSSSDRDRELEIRDKLLSLTLPDKTEFLNAYQTIQAQVKEGELDLTSRQDKHIIYSVWISFAEIYNDTIYDLLSSDYQKKRLPLKMVTDKQGRTFIKDLRTVYVNSDEEAYQILLAGQYKSRIAATTLNPQSSRSHCIFTVKLLKYYAESAPEDVEVSAISFCDLAGSGRLKMTTNIGDRLKETQNINTSLLVLGRCLKSIWEGQSVRRKSELVGPFRESKLTRLFQRALSGKEHITLIVNVNPVPSLYAETQNVLNFSAIAKKIIVEPVKEIKNKMFMSRFSRVVAHSTRTVTDWDQAVVEDSTHEIYPEKVKTSDYILREYYDDLSAEYEKLKIEYSALKTSMLDKDLEIREEMANTYTGLINDLEATWRSRSKDVEEQQENLLAWSVNQVENFYKEKLSRMNSRKRRRWDDGDAVNDDREADFRDIEAENASLTAKFLVTKETIKELRSARENAIADKNKAVFELSLVKEQIIGVKKMLEAAENDVRCKDDGAHLTEELKRQLSSREDRIKNLKEFLEEAKEEYIRITSDAGQMHEDLKEANATLIENAEKIEDLEEQLEQSSVFLAKRVEEIEHLTGKLESQNKQLIEFADRASSAEEELKKSESIRLNLMNAVEDLNRLHKDVCISTPRHLNPNNHSFTDSEDDIEFEIHRTKSNKTSTISEIIKVESSNSPCRVEFQTRDQFEDRQIQVSSKKESKRENIEIQDTYKIVGPDESVHKKNRDTYNSIRSGEINDSGIAMTIGSANQTIEQMNSTVDTDLEAHVKNIQIGSPRTHGENSADEQPTSLQLEHGDLIACSLGDDFRMTKLFQELGVAHQEMAIGKSDFSSDEVQAKRYTHNLASIESELRSLNANKLHREFQFADIIVNLEMKIDEYKAKIDMFQKELTMGMTKARFYYDSLNDKVSAFEIQLSKAHVKMETVVMKRFDAHGDQIKKLETEDLELKDDLQSQFTQQKSNITVEKDIDVIVELQPRVEKSELALAKFQRLKGDQHKQLPKNVEGLTFLENPIEIWPIQESENPTAMQTLHDQLKYDTETNEAGVSKELWAINSELHESESLEDESKLPSEVNIDSCDSDFGDSKQFDEPRNNEKLEDYVKSFIADVMKAPTSTSVDHSDTGSTTMQGASISSNSMFPVENRSSITANEVFKQTTEGDVDPQSEVPQVHTRLRIQQIVLIIFFVVVYFVEWF